MKLHQEKTIHYLFDLHIISRKVLRVLPVNKVLQFGGSLSVRKEGVLLLKILWICKLLKFDRKAWNSSELWLKAGLRYKTIKNIFYDQTLAQSLWIHQMTDHFEL